MELTGTSVVVTGGASGLGEAAARAFVARGARVAILDRNADTTAHVARDLGGIGVVCDVTNTDEINSALDAITDQHGVPRVAIIAAGIAAAKRVVGKGGALPLEEFTSIINVNLVGTFNVMRLVAERMSLAEPTPSDERGVIITTASAAAFDGQIGQAAYSASKGGVAAMTLPVARELARFGIRVTCIAPGLFNTPMMRTLPEEAQQSIAASIPFPARLGEPEEYAKLAVHLAENTYLNGDVFRIDGALRLAYQ